MKKRIFIAIHYLEIGGAEISLIGLLAAIDYSKYDVDLFVYSHRGDLMKRIPGPVNLLPEIPVYSYMEKPMVETLMAGHIRLVLARLQAKLLYSRYCQKKHPKEGSAILQYVADCVTPVLSSINQTVYDLAISFLTPHNIVLEKVQAKKKIAWIHTDYSYIDVDSEKELPVWSRYDYIASISEAVTDAFLNRFPSLSSKIRLIENILSPSFVRGRANESDISFPHENDRVNLLSIGRFTEAKNFDNVPDILKRVREIGINAYWYIIGYGGSEALIRNKTAEAGMEDYLILLGKQENPYPYLKVADIYVQPSRFEGKSVTVREAQMLCKPLVVTNYLTASSQVQHGKDGIIVPLENEACAKELASFIRNRPLQQEIESYLRIHDYGNESEVKKIYTLID